MDKGATPEKKLTARLPLDLWRQLREIAKSEQRSLNAQIIFVLREWLNETQRNQSKK